MQSRWTMLSCVGVLLVGCHDVDVIDPPGDSRADEAGGDMVAVDGGRDGAPDAPTMDGAKGKEAGPDLGKDQGVEAGLDAGKDQGKDQGVEAGAPPTIWKVLTPGGTGTYASVAAEGPVVLVGTSKGDLLRSSNSGTAFSAVFKSTGILKEIDMDGQRAVAISQEGDLHYSVNAGANWSTSKQSCGKGSTSIAISGATVVAGCAGQYCVSHDGGANFACIAVTVGPAKVLFMGVAAAKVGGHTVLLAAGHYNSSGSNPVVHRWDSNSKAWADLTSTLPKAGNILHHAELLSSGLAVIGSSSGKVLYSSDGGKTWYVSGAATSTHTLAAVAATLPTLVIAGSSQYGAYLSTNGGGYFKQITATAVTKSGYSSAAFDGKGGVYLAGKSLVKGVP